MSESTPAVKEIELLAASGAPAMISTDSDLTTGDDDDDDDSTAAKKTGAEKQRKVGDNSISESSLIKLYKSATNLRKQPEVLQFLRQQLNICLADILRVAMNSRKVQNQTIEENDIRNAIKRRIPQLTDDMLNLKDQI